MVIKHILCISLSSAEVVMCKSFKHMCSCVNRRYLFFFKTPSKCQTVGEWHESRICVCVWNISSVWHSCMTVLHICLNGYPGSSAMDGWKLFCWAEGKKLHEVKTARKNLHEKSNLASRSHSPISEATEMRLLLSLLLYSFCAKHQTSISNIY